MLDLMQDAVRVIELLLFNAKWDIFQLYHGENKLYFDDDDDDVHIVLDHLTNTLSWILIVLAHWNNRPPENMSRHLDISFWFQANPSLFFLLNTACLAVKL